MSGGGELVVTGLTKKWTDEIVAIRDVSFKAPKGQFIVVLGPSGSGKSTLLRCITRLVEPTSGGVSLDGVNITALKGRAMMKMRRRIGFIFQNFNLIENYTVMQNVMAGRIGSNPLWRNVLPFYGRRDKQIAEDYIRRLGIYDKLDQRVDTLSGGQQQRVAIASAAAQQPDVILADEPMAELDPMLSRIILDLLSELSKENGITVLVNIHVLELALAYAERIIGLNRGRIVFDGPPDKLTEKEIEKIYANADEVGEYYQG